MINVGIFVFEFLFRLNLAYVFGLVPANFWRGHIWQPITYMFLHGGMFHLLINMFILWMFGTTLESTWRSRRFIKFYFICGVGAGLLNSVMTPNTVIPTVGASGAIYGLLMAFGILFPEQIILIWGIFPVKAKFFVVGIGIIELMAALGTSDSGIAHFAHLGGMLFGLVYMKWDDWRFKLEKWQHEQKRRRHLKVVWDRERERELLQRHVDELLDKISRSGLESLSEEERQDLKEASQKMKELDDQE
jgi:membrane associated rhomboid family serine protease